MIRYFLAYVIFCAGLFSNAQAPAKSADLAPKQEALVQTQGPCTLAVTLKETIGAATIDIFQRVSKRAEELNCKSILIRINTPGGHLHSTRLITEHIIASPVPFLCLISPAGGHAGSAGAIILQACHVAGGLTATNVGAATPVMGGGQDIPDDLKNKILNDTVSWVQGLAALRGRSQDFSKRIITEGLAVTSEQAVKMKAMDFATTTEEEFLNKAQGLNVLTLDKKMMAVEVGPVQEFALDMRYKILQFVSEPEWAYLLFLGALLLLYAEFSNPGLFLPGVTGAILLVLSLISFNKLDANMGALALMVLGLAFWIAELFINSKGILGIAGTISFILGSFLLFDRERTGISIPLQLILTAGFVFGGFSAAMAYLAARSLNRPKHDFDQQMKASVPEIIEVAEDGKSGMVKVVGEIWKFESSDFIKPMDQVEIIKRANLKVILKKKT